MRTTTWRKELRDAMQGSTVSWRDPQVIEPADPGPVLAYSPNETAFDIEFCPGYGSEEGPPVLAWTAEYVYFPASYDGAEWMGRAPRNPRPLGQHHVGGG